MSNASEPAPPSDRIRGSRNNSEGSARTTRGGIDVSSETERALRAKVINHNKTARLHVTIGMLKAVYRRGAGAFSVSHRPGKTRNQWAMARVNAFLDLVANGTPNRAAYVSDNDLLPKGHRLASKTPAKAFASQRQWRWAFATEQPFARQWADESTWSKLPRRIRKRATKAEGGPSPGGPSPVGTYVQDREGQGQRTTPMDQSAGAGERIGGQLCRDAAGQYVNCNDPSATTDSKMALYRRETQRIRSMNAAQYKEFKEEQRAQRRAGGGGGKPKLTPEQEAAQKEQERLKEEEEQRKAIAQNIEKTSETSPLGKDDAKAFAAFGDPDDPKGLTDAQTEKLEKLGLVKRDKENNFASMTREGRAYLQSLRSGDKAEARDAFADVQEAIAERRAREAERAQIKEEREKAKQEREKARQERASRSKGGKGDKQKQDQALQQEIMRQAQMIAYQMIDDFMARQSTDGGIIAAPPERDPERKPEKEKERPNLPPRTPPRWRQRDETKSREPIMNRAFAIAQASFQPPRAVQRAARRALMVRRNSPPSQRGMTAVGLARARDLASGRPVSMNTIIRMRAYFSRHEIDKTGSTWDDRGKGWQAWHGWGGDAGRRWAEHVLRTAAKAVLFPGLTFRV
jgi:hypothetical protein